MVKNLPANAGGTTDIGSISGPGRLPGGGNGNPLQYSCLENLVDRGAWQATVHGVTKSQKQLITQHNNKKEIKKSCIKARGIWIKFSSCCSSS